MYMQVGPESHFNWKSLPLKLKLYAWIISKFKAYLKYIISFSQTLFSLFSWFIIVVTDLQTPVVNPTKLFVCDESMISYIWT